MADDPLGRLMVMPQIFVADADRHHGDGCRVVHQPVPRHDSGRFSNGLIIVHEDNAEVGPMIPRDMGRRSRSSLAGSASRNTTISLRPMRPSPPVADREATCAIKVQLGPDTQRSDPGNGTWDRAKPGSRGLCRSSDHP